MMEDLKWPRRIGLMIIVLGFLFLLPAARALDLGSVRILNFGFAWDDVVNSRDFAVTCNYLLLTVAALAGWGWWKKGETSL